MNSNGEEYIIRTQKKCEHVYKNGESAFIFDEEQGYYCEMCYVKECDHNSQGPDYENKVMVCTDCGEEMDDDWRMEFLEETRGGGN